MQISADIIIIGAGPIGLYLAGKCEKAGLNYLVIEGESFVGGQITKLYPKKDIVDIPNFDSIVSGDYIKELMTHVNPNKIVFETLIQNVIPGEIIEISTAKTSYFCKKLVFATGLGSTTPRLLGLENEEKCLNIIYSVHSIDNFKNKKVAIFGGGDSALDWAKAISSISNDVHLIHRRTEFRGNPETIKDSKNLSVHLPYVPFELKVDGNIAKEIIIKKVDEENSFISIPVDYVIVNFGNIPTITKWPFEMTGSFLNVDSNFKVANNIFAIGDVAQYQNKTRRIAPGNKEADKVFEQISC